MSELNPQKLHIVFLEASSASPDKLVLPRRYTLTHSDFSGDLFLTIGAEYDSQKLKGLYTRLMRDEVLAEWQRLGAGFCLHIYCHVSGGLVIGSARWRNSILLRHMRLVIEALCFGDRSLIAMQPELNQAKVLVHFRSHKSAYDRIEDWGVLQSYQING